MKYSAVHGSRTKHHLAALQYVLLKFLCLVVTECTKMVCCRFKWWYVAAVNPAYTHIRHINAGTILFEAFHIHYHTSEVQNIHADEPVTSIKVFVVEFNTSHS